MEEASLIVSGTVNVNTQIKRLRERAGTGSAFVFVEPTPSDILMQVLGHTWGYWLKEGYHGSKGPVFVVVPRP